jgi:hypothetical protein
METKELYYFILILGMMVFLMVSLFVLFLKTYKLVCEKAKLESDNVDLFFQLEKAEIKVEELRSIVDKTLLCKEIGDTVNKEL